MTKQLIYNEEAWKKLDSGAKQVYDAVKVTLGPKGHNVVIDNNGILNPTITKDGVTVARVISLKDKFENIGAQLIKEVAARTNDVAGDGTTTSTILGYEIFKEGLKSVKRGMNPAAIKRGIDKAVNIALDDILTRAKPVNNKRDIEHVASISANNDPEIGKLIAEAMDKVGKDGVITVEESKGVETTLDVVEGMQFDKGFVSPYMITDTTRMEAVMEDPYILITDKRISAINDLLPILEKTMNMGKPLVIIADDIDGEALSTLVLNKLRGTLNVVAVRAPGFGERRKAMLADISILTGGMLFSDEAGDSLEMVEVEMLGKAKKVRVSKGSTTIVEGTGKVAEIKARIAQIRAELELTESEYEREQFQARLAKLTGGVAVIRAGASTESELKEKKYRIDDALEATKAAVEEGIVAGGGVTLIRTIPIINELECHSTNEDESTGMAIVKRALESPLKVIASNAGIEGAVVVEAVKKLTGNKGYNALTNKYEDLFKAGVVDPAKVTRSSLQNAASIASMLLATSVLIVEDDE